MDGLLNIAIISKGGRRGVQATVFAILSPNFPILVSTCETPRRFVNLTGVSIYMLYVACYPSMNVTPDCGFARISGGFTRNNSYEHCVEWSDLLYQIHASVRNKIFNNLPSIYSHIIQF